MIIEYRGYSCQNYITVVHDKIYCQKNYIKILCETVKAKMIKNKIQRDHYVQIVTSNPLIMHEKTDKYISGSYYFLNENFVNNVIL